MHRALPLAVGAAVAFFTLQAAYWPLVLTKTSTLHFWQMHWAAEVGYRVGAPVVAAILFSGFTGLTQVALSIAMAIAWSLAVAWLTKVGVAHFHHLHAAPVAAPAQEITPAASSQTAPAVPVQTPAHLARSAARPSAPSD